MISAKLANKCFVRGGVFNRGDYLSRIWWLSSEIKQLTFVGQNSMNVQMKNISHPTFRKVLKKVQNKGYKLEGVEYSYNISEGKFIISWKE